MKHQGYLKMDILFFNKMNIKITKIKRKNDCRHHAPAARGIIFTLIIIIINITKGTKFKRLCHS